MIEFVYDVIVFGFFEFVLGFGEIGLGVFYFDYVDGGDYCL